jgi:hypothetical protein
VLSATDWDDQSHFTSRADFYRNSKRMSEEEILESISQKKSELTELQTNGKITERVLLEQRNDLAATKAELMSGVHARMELIEMLRVDIVRMAYEESARIAEQEFDSPQK